MVTRTKTTCRTSDETAVGEKESGEVTNTEAQIAQIALKYRGANEIEIVKKMMEDVRRSAISITADKALKIVNDLVEGNILQLKSTPLIDASEGAPKLQPEEAWYEKGMDSPSDYGR